MYFIEKSCNSAEQDTSWRIEETTNEKSRGLSRHYKLEKIYLKSQDNFKERKHSEKQRKRQKRIERKCYASRVCCHTPQVCKIVLKNTVFKQSAERLSCCCSWLIASLFWYSNKERCFLTCHEVFRSISRKLIKLVVIVKVFLGSIESTCELNHVFTISLFTSKFISSDILRIKVRFLLLLLTKEACTVS